MNKILSKEQENATKNLSEENKKRKLQYGCEQYRNFSTETEPSEEEKNIKCQYACEQYRNFSEEEKRQNASICSRAI